MKNQKNYDLMKEFRFGSQGYELVKGMMFIYAFKKANIEYPLFCQEKIDALEYLIQLHQLADANLTEIDKSCGRGLGEIIRDCVLGFEKHKSIHHKMNYALNILNDFTTNDIENFIINDVNLMCDRYIFCPPKNSSLIDLIIKLLEKDGKESWLDLGCGNGDYLIELTKKHNNIKCYGSESDYNLMLLTKIKMFFLKTNAIIREDKIIYNSYKEFVDVGYTNTPFLISLSKDNSNYNNYNKYIGNLKPFQNGDWIFVDRLLQCIKERGIIVIPESCLMNHVDIEQRKNIIEKNLVEGVIKLPDNLFTRNILVSIIVFNKNKSNKEIKFLDATKMSYEGRRLSEINVDEIFDAYNSESNLIKINIDDISKEDYCLSVKKYTDVNDIVLENEIVLENVVDEIFRGAQIPASIIDEYSKVEDDEDVYKLVSVGDIQNGTFDIDTLQVIKNDKKFDRYLIKNGDVIVSSKSTKIKTAVVDVPKDQKFVATGSLLVIRCNQDKINPVYLKAFFDSKNGSKLLESIQTGTSIISINTSALMKLKISLLDRAKQDEIAKGYLLKLNQYKDTQHKLNNLEKELNNIFDEFIGG